MKAYRWLALIAAALLTALGVLILVVATSTTSAASPAPCAMRLSVEPTPEQTGDMLCQIES